MSDFENTFREEIEKAYNHGKVGAIFDVDLSLYKAIASMQGEAVARVIIEHPSKENGRDPYGYAVANFLYEKPIYNLPNGKHYLFTYSPSASAEIARLTKELEEARKDAERWEAICNLWFLCSELKLIQNEDGGYSICEMEFVDNLLVSDFCGDTPEQAIDAAISKIGGGE